jgi:hypothetical protein
LEFQVTPILHAEVSASQTIKILLPSLAEEGLGIRAFEAMGFRWDGTSKQEKRGDTVLSELRYHSPPF